MCEPKKTKYKYVVFKKVTSEQKRPITVWKCVIRRTNVPVGYIEMHTRPGYWQFRSYTGSSLEAQDLLNISVFMSQLE
jgi:hypothetical protein